jgi:hypothetical protein
VGIRTAVDFEFDESWNNSFEKTYHIISKSIDTTQYYTYRDSIKKKPLFLTEMTNDAILPDKKDNWNPSDLWMVKKTYNGEDILTLVKRKDNEIAHNLNKLLSTHFNNGNLIGISLKKVDS